MHHRRLQAVTLRSTNEAHPNDQMYEAVRLAAFSHGCSHACMHVPQCWLPSPHMQQMLHVSILSYLLGRI